MRDWTARQVRLLILDRDNPWPGLHAFEEEARDFFHGREQEAAALLGRVVEAPVTVLFGKSGLGKTSLLKAGLFPRLRDRGFLPVYLRLAFGSEAPNLRDQMARALRDELELRAIDAPPIGERETLWEYLHRAGLEFWSSGNRLLTPVLVLDQFEEIYTLGPRLGKAVEAFRIDLGDLAENRIPAALADRLETDEAAASGLDLRSMRYKLIVSLREDFLPDLETDRRVIPALGRVRVRLLAMRPEQAFTAVRDAAPHLLDERVARRIVRFVAAEQNDAVRPGDSVAPFTREEAETEIEPALLSLFCRGLNEQRKKLGKERFDQELVEHAKQGIIQDYYRSCLEGLPDQVGRFIETELITEKGHRNSFAREDAVPSHLSEDELDRLIRARLIRLEERYGTQRIELTHDLLTKAVRVHRDARRAEERMKEHEERERQLEAEAQIGRRFRALSALLTVALVAALAMTALAVYQKRQAESPALAYEALGRVVLKREVEDGLKRAILAVEKAETETARDALTLALAESVMRKRWEVPLPQASALAVSPDGQRVAAATPRGTGIWDVATGQLRASVCGQDAMALRWTPDSARLVRGLRNGTVDLWDATDPSGPPSAPSILVAQPDELLDMDLRPDGRELAIVTDVHALKRYEISPGEAKGSPSARVVPAGAAGRTPAEVWRAAYSPDGLRLAVSDSAGTLTLLDLASGQPTACRADSPAEPTRLRFSDRKLGLVGISDSSFRVRAWRVDDCVSGQAPAISLQRTVGDFLFARDGEYVMTVSDDGAFRLWDPTGKGQLHLRRVPGHVPNRIVESGGGPSGSAPGGERIGVITAAWSRETPAQGRLTHWSIARPTEREALDRLDPRNPRETGKKSVPTDELLRRARRLAEQTFLSPQNQEFCPGPAAP